MSVLIVVVVPLTVKLPSIVTLPVADTSANVTLLDVATGCPILKAPLVLLYVIPVLPLRWALTSEALGPVYVNTPVPESYANDPSPPESVTEICALVSAALGPVYVNTPVPLS